MLAGGGDEAAGGVVVRGATNSVTLSIWDKVVRTKRGSRVKLPFAVSTGPSPGFLASYGDRLSQRRVDASRLQAPRGQVSAPNRSASQSAMRGRTTA
jgi:hypothetical protein